MSAAAQIGEDEERVTWFINSDGNFQVVTDGEGARCPECGYPERHRIFTGSDLIADGCPSCEAPRPRA